MQVKTQQVKAVEWTAPAPNNTQRRKRIRISLLFMAPAFLVITIFMLGPAFWAFYISFTNMALTGTGAGTIQWIGAQNFVQILHDAEFFKTPFPFVPNAGSAESGFVGLYRSCAWGDGDNAPRLADKLLEQVEGKEPNKFDISLISELKGQF